ncbi:MAG: acetyl-CoA carboxylase biotin carboxyl carrier protein subunit, partial [Comamonadaceae bacterium]|nr:acetyl-CoA carboxylase biotin carboxyl carrier protein subunit [Comamonadaceae bacterium]
LRRGGARPARAAGRRRRGASSSPTAASATGWTSTASARAATPSAAAAPRADITVDALGRFERRITCGGRRHRLLVGADRQRLPRRDRRRRASRSSARTASWCAPGWPALVVAMHVAARLRRWRAGDPIAVLESMKMESTVTAPMAGEVVVGGGRRQRAGRGRRAAGAAAPGIGRAPAARGAPSAERVDLSGLEQRTDFTRKPCERVYGPLGNYLLGYDLPAAGAAQAADRAAAAWPRSPSPATRRCWPARTACSTSTPTSARCTARRPRPSPTSWRCAPENTQEHFMAFLQWLDADRAGLPAELPRRAAAGARPLRRRLVWHARRRWSRR